jgi:hypothetical protein
MVSAASAARLKMMLTASTSGREHQTLLAALFIGARVHPRKQHFRKTEFGEIGNA